MNRKSKIFQLHGQAGFGLIDLMVGSSLGLLVLSFFLYIVGSTASSGKEMLKSSKLNQELSATMLLIVNDIRRAGFWEDNDLENAPNTPYSVAGLDLSTPTAGCILYSYDYDENRSNPPSNSERYGFKLSAGGVWMRTSGTSGTDCSNGTWQSVTDANMVTITALTFSFTNSKCLNASTKQKWDSLCGTAATTTPPSGESYQYVEIRQADIVLTGTLASDSTVTKTLTETVRVRNDRIYSVSTP